MIRPESKLPFYIPEGRNTHDYPIMDANSNIIVEEPDGMKNRIKDREFIVHACNNYEKLVEHLKAFLKPIDPEIADIPIHEAQYLLKELDEL